MSRARSWTRSLAPALAALAGACAAPQVAYNPHADFSAIKRVAVAAFGGPQGDAAADMLTQNLVAQGADVVERQQLNAVLSEQHLAAAGILNPATIHEVGKILGVDAIFVGSVVQSLPAQSYVVTQPRRAVVGTVTPVSGGAVFAEPVLGLPGSQVITTSANVSLVSRMVDVTTGSILWSASMSYEGFDVESAMQAITDAFAKSLVPIWPALGVPQKK